MLRPKKSNSEKIVFFDRASQFRVWRKGPKMRKSLLGQHSERPVFKAFAQSWAKIMSGGPDVQWTCSNGALDCPT